MPDYDLAVVGGGPGGYTAAIRAAQLGLKTALIEKDRVGGLCLNWGCIPSKALLAGADLLHDLRRSGEFGIHFESFDADLGAAVDRSRRIVERFVGGVEGLLQQNKVERINGVACFTAPARLRIEPIGIELNAANILIATGAAPRSLPGLVQDGHRILGSRDALALRKPPSSIVIVGGGPIGCEFAYLFRSYGSEVTIVEALPGLLPSEDTDLGRELQRAFERQGIAVRPGSLVSRASVSDDRVTLTLDGGGSLEAEYVLVGAGFVPDNGALGLETAGVRTEGGWIAVDDFCSTNVPGIWAAGDVTGRLLLAHVASHQGTTAVEKMAGLEPPPIEYDRIPRAVFSQPQVAALGMTETQARERGFDVRVGRFPLRASGKAVALGETEGFVKLVIDNSSKAILGWHIIGHDAAELLGEATVASALEATTAELIHAVHAHPTLSEALKEAALGASGEAVHFFSPRRN